MSNSNTNIDENVKEILDNIDKNKSLTSEEKNKRKKNIEESLNFEKVIEDIDISDNSNRIIFTDGEDQLLYEDGEFFSISSTDSSKSKIKKKRSEARNMYIEYFIKYQLNPILKQKELDKTVQTISRNPEKERNITKELKKDIKTPLKNDVKKVNEKSNYKDEKIR